jgi:hypothetical protein
MPVVLPSSLGPRPTLMKSTSSASLKPSMNALSTRSLPRPGTPRPSSPWHAEQEPYLVLPVAISSAGSGPASTVGAGAVVAVGAGADVAAGLSDPPSSPPPHATTNITPTMREARRVNFFMCIGLSTGIRATVGCSRYRVWLLVYLYSVPSVVIVSKVYFPVFEGRHHAIPTPYFILMGFLQEARKGPRTGHVRKRHNPVSHRR